MSASPDPPRPRPGPPGDALAAAAAAHRAGSPVEAEAAYREALRREPADASALYGLGVLCHQTGRAAEAEHLLRRAAEAGPRRGDVLGALAGVLGGRGRHAEAVTLLREAVHRAPGDADAWNNLGVALEDTGRAAEAVDAYARALALRPGWAAAHNHRGNALRALGRPGEAEAAHRRAVRLDPASASAWKSLAVTLAGQGRAAEAAACQRRVAGLRPGSAAAGSDLLHLLHYDPAVPRRELLAEARRWADRHAEPPTIFARGHDNDADPDRPLRVGLVSGDFREHPVARLTEPVLSHLDRSAFHAVCYSDVPRPDAVTGRLRALAGTWRETAGLADAALAELIRRDRIDVLVDLAGHMAGNRLPAFARRPAPVQVTHFNYPDSTGMSAMDWRVTDDLSEPPGEADASGAERLYRLPRCAWAYGPGPDVPGVGPLPASGNGFVTFAALNKPLKHGPGVLALWARVLAAVPGSRLMLWAAEGGAAGGDAPPADHPAVREALAACGVGAGRLQFVRRRPRPRYLELYDRADIALGPFPYNGGVTTCDALWMGVPVVTLAGEGYMARQGLMLLTSTGRPEWVATSQRQYVETAAGLASDLARLASIRSGLWEQFARCPVADAAGFTRDLQAAWRDMWRAWCGSGPKGRR